MEKETTNYDKDNVKYQKMEKEKMTIMELLRANKIAHGICPECGRQHNYPNQAGDCCDKNS